MSNETWDGQVQLMSTSARRAYWSGICLMSCVIGAGCGVFQEANRLGKNVFADSGTRTREDELYRKQYQIDRDPAAMQWLLANRIEPGMSVANVNQVFGETGEREYNDRQIKTGSGFYRTSDTVYRWGPDNQGRSVYLVFREERLFNFDPNEFR